MNIKELCQKYNCQPLNEEKIRRIYSIIDEMLSIIDEKTFSNACFNSPEDLQIEISLESKEIKLWDVEEDVIYETYELNDYYYSSLISIFPLITEISLILSKETFVIKVDEKLNYEKDSLDLGVLRDTIIIDGYANEFFYIPISSFSS